MRGRREHPRKVSIVDLETTSPQLLRRIRWMARNVDRQEGCRWTDGRTVERIAEELHGVKRDAGGIPMALHRRELQSHRRLCAPDGYRGTARVVAKGGATSIGELLPVALVVLSTEGWISARFHARGSATPRTNRVRRDAARDFYAFAFRRFPPRMFLARPKLTS